ncbi:hypothetical protein SK128_028253 [Halocaridina rubra]|uniref:Uncharacterized protein n=1 Tax=Halocaridina rubra TaxID=373956 RepID=A0AAN8XEE7_HALRR
MSCMLTFFAYCPLSVEVIALFIGKISYVMAIYAPKDTFASLYAKFLLRRAEVDVINEIQEETTLSNGKCDLTTASATKDISNGVLCGAASQEKLNGTSGHLEFHSDMGSEDENSKPSLDTAVCPLKTVDAHSSVDISADNIPSKVILDSVKDFQATTVEGETETQDLGDISISVKETHDSITESSLSSPSMEESEEDPNKGNSIIPGENETQHNIVCNM